MLCVAMVYFDAPYGVTGQEWDVAPSPAQLKRILSVVGQHNLHPNPVLILWHNMNFMNSYSVALEEIGWTLVHPFMWVKEGCTSTPGLPYPVITEFALIAWREKKVMGAGATAYVNAPSSSPYMERVNLWIGPGPRPFMKYEGSVVNPAEKPSDLAYFLAKRFVPPGGWVLNIGTGSGGDLAGFVRAGCNVLGIEKNAFQFQMTLVRIGKLKEFFVEQAKHTSERAVMRQKRRAEKKTREQQKEKDQLLVVPPTEHPLVKSRRLRKEKGATICWFCKERIFDPNPAACESCGGPLHPAREGEDICSYACSVCRLAGALLCDEYCHRRMESIYHTVTQPPLPSQEMEVVDGRALTVSLEHER